MSMHILFDVFVAVLTVLAVAIKALRCAYVDKGRDRSASTALKACGMVGMLYMVITDVCEGRVFGLLSILLLSIGSIDADIRDMAERYRSSRCDIDVAEKA